MGCQWWLLKRLTFGITWLLSVLKLKSEARRLHFYFQEPNSQRCICVWKVACQQKQLGDRDHLSLFRFDKLNNYPTSSTLSKHTNAEAVNGLRVGLLTCGKKTRVNWTQYYLLSHLFALCPWFCWRRVCAPVQTDKSALIYLLPRRVVTRNLRLLEGNERNERQMFLASRKSTLFSTFVSCYIKKWQSLWK